MDKVSKRKPSRKVYFAATLAIGATMLMGGGLAFVHYSLAISHSTVAALMQAYSHPGGLQL